MRLTVSLDRLIRVERIIYSKELWKINDYDKAQRRTLAFSNKRIINFDGKKIKRMIDLEKVKGLTINDNQTNFEFVFHVTGESDYRFKAEMKTQREEVVKLLKHHYRE